MSQSPVSYPVSASISGITSFDSCDEATGFGQEVVLSKVGTYIVTVKFIDIPGHPHSSMVRPLGHGGCDGRIDRSGDRSGG